MMNRTEFLCDSCGHRAGERATKDEQDLIFCGHHANQHRAVLLAEGWTVAQIEDETVDSDELAMVDS